MHQYHEHTRAAGTIADDDKAVCPVMQLPVSKKEAEANGLTRTIDGHTYYLCCRTCGTIFASQPEQYLDTSKSKEGS